MKKIDVPPMDVYNGILVSNAHPENWLNPEPASVYNLVVIGAGTAGLVTAAGAAGLGAKVALIEKHLMGGDCLNVGCVPSKALIRASRAFADARDAGDFGVILPVPPKVDFPKVMERMRRLRSQISPNDSVHRFKDLGVDIFLGEGKFSGPNTMEVDGKTLRFTKAAITTGARAAALPIPGLAETGYLTNETIFSITKLPARLAVIGAGPIGCEMAQVFRRFGSEVFLIEADRQILVREDHDAAQIVERTFQEEGIHLVCCAKINQVEKHGHGKLIRLESDGNKKEIAVDEILVGVGRAPNVEGLNLESAGVKYSKRGVEVNDCLQTTNPNIYAAGDVALPYKFTHTADATARILIQNALFLGRKKASSLVIPWCTYTDPEIAHVGLYEHDAKAKGFEIETFVQKLHDVDRAILDGEDEGMVKVHVKKGTDKIVGATVVARHAGEMISELSLAIVSGAGLGTIAQVIHPYPTQAEAIKRTGDAYNRKRLTPFVKALFSRWLDWRR